MVNEKLISFLTRIRHPKEVHISSNLVKESGWYKGFYFKPRDYVKGVMIKWGPGPAGLDLSLAQCEEILDVLKGNYWKPVEEMFTLPEDTRVLLYTPSENKTLRYRVADAREAKAFCEATHFKVLSLNQI